MAATTPPPTILDIHTPTSSFAVVHSLTQQSLQSLYDTLTCKVHTVYHGARVGHGWLRYEFNDSIWNLDDDQDYTIFAWRQQQLLSTHAPSTSSSSHDPPPPAPTLHLHNPAEPLPSPPAYLNASYYLFQPSRVDLPRIRRLGASTPSSAHSKKSAKSGKGGAGEDNGNGIPAFKRKFEKFHAENGVRTVIGSIGPVQNVRMLLKSGHRHVYISRKFAVRHGFIPKDAAPGHYGYGGLVSIGTWPIRLTPSSSFNPHPEAPGHNRIESNVSKPTMIDVYLSEEPHFDVVLGRSFFEKRKIRTNGTDPTDVVCLDIGEKVECELVILKDGRGEIVTVT